MIEKYKVIYHQDMGRVVVAKDSYTKDELICVGRRTGIAPMRDSHSLQVNENTHVYLNNPAQLFSHSCDPNVYLMDNDIGGYNFFAVRDIVKGEILSLHYGMMEAESISVPKCCCNADNCYGKSIGFKEASPDLQAFLYGLGVANYLQEWHTNRQGVPMVAKEKNMMDKEPVLGHGNKILASWTAPRSRSTAFERMMMERGDFHTIHDPFGPHYYHQTRHLRPVEVDPTREVRFERIVENLQQATQSQPRQVFIKDFPWHFLPYVDVDERFLSLFTHTFLIRHPAQMIASYLAGWPDALESELGYPELAEMFDRVKAYQGSVPIVVDADDLVNAPAATIQAYCDALQIPFLPNALSWQPGERKEFIYMEGGRWHGNLNQSGGFQSFENKTYPTMESSPRLRELVAAMMPYYEKLHAVKL